MDHDQSLHHLQQRGHDPILTSDELMEHLERCNKFPNCTFNQLMDLQYLVKVAFHPRTCSSPERRDLLFQMARYQAKHAITNAEKAAADYMRILLQLHKDAMNQGETPFTGSQWLKLQRMASSMTAKTPTSIIQRMKLRNLVDLPLEDGLPFSFNAGGGFNGFRLLATLVISFGLTSPIRNLVGCTLDALSEEKRFAAEHSANDTLKSKRDPRLIGQEINLSFPKSDFLLDGSELCNCIPRLFRDFLDAWLQATGTCDGRISSALEVSWKPCRAKHCFRRARSAPFPRLNHELYFFIDLHIRLIKLKPQQTRQERAYAARLLQVLSGYASKHPTYGAAVWNYRT